MKPISTLITLSRPEGRNSLLFWRLFFGVIAGTLISTLYSGSPVLESLELGMLNWRYKIGEKIAEQGWYSRGNYVAQSKIAIVAFDNDSQFDLGCARFNETNAQSQLAALINKIEEEKPTLIVIDLDIRGATNESLVDCMRYHRNIVLSLFGTLEGNSQLPSAEFLRHAIGYGYREIDKEPNGSIYRIADQVPEHHGLEPTGTEEVLSLTRAILEPYSHITGIDYVSRLNPVSLDEIPYIYFHKMKFPIFSMSKVLRNNFEPKQFKDKIILLGSILTQRKKDPHKVHTPFRTESPEILIQADELATVINNEVLWSFPQKKCKQFLLIIGALVGSLASSLPLGKRTLAMLLCGVILLILAQFAFMYWHLILPVVSPLVIIITGFVLGTVIYLDTGLRQRNRELAATREMMQVRAEEERKRIAGDLHDETLPALSSIARMADDMSMKYSDAAAPKQMREKLDSAIQEMRRVINDLHPSVLETMGFVPALENLGRILERETKISVKFKSDREIEENEMSGFTKLQIYRIIQESLNNVRKHSKANICELDLQCEGNILEISVIDNGVGIAPGLLRPDSHGLLNIKHRAGLVGAKVIWSKPKEYSSGTEFKVSIPLLVKNENNETISLSK